MKGERDVKRIRRADAQMKPDEIAVPVPNKIAQSEHTHDQHHIQREKIWGERDDKICFGNDDVAAGRLHLHFFHLAAEQPRPQRVRQFMAEDVNPHRLGQQTKKHQPARRATGNGNPRRICATTGLQHFQQSHSRARANGQQQYRN